MLLIHRRSLSGVPKQSVADLHLCPTTPAYSQTASQHLASPHQLSTFIKASFPCCSSTTNRTAPAVACQLTPWPSAFFRFVLSVHQGAWCGRQQPYWTLLRRAKESQRKPPGTVPGLQAAQRVGGWSKGIKVLRGAQRLTPTWAP